MSYATKTATPRVPYFYWNCRDLKISDVSRVLSNTHQMTYDRGRWIITRTDGKTCYGELTVKDMKYVVREGDTVRIYGKYEFESRYKT